MSKTIEMQAELAERILAWLDTDEPNDDGWVSELRAMLTAPVVERQEPVALFESVIGKNPDAFLHGPVYQVTESEVREFARLLYTSPPAPVAVVLPDLDEIRQYHADAAYKLRSYADDAGLRDSDVKHYTKRAEVHERMVLCLDSVKELNK